MENSHLKSEKIESMPSERETVRYLLRLLSSKKASTSHPSRLESTSAQLSPSEALCRKPDDSYAQWTERLTLCSLIMQGILCDTDSLQSSESGHSMELSGEAQELLCRLRGSVRSVLRCLLQTVEDAVRVAKSIPSSPARSLSAKETLQRLPRKTSRKKSKDPTKGARKT